MQPSNATVHDAGHANRFGDLSDRDDRRHGDKSRRGRRDRRDLHADSARERERQEHEEAASHFNARYQSLDDVMGQVLTPPQNCAAHACGGHALNMHQGHRGRMDFH